jgi:hypothetical protein
VPQNSPTDPRHFVRQSNNGFVPSSFFSDAVDPSAQGVIFVGRSKDDGPSAMDQLCAKVSIPAFTNAQKNILTATAVLTWNQAK